MSVDLFNPHDGLTGRDGGPYLDEVERRNAETIRAAKENRKPDYDNAPATAGTPLVTAAQLAAKDGVNSNPSQQNVDRNKLVTEALVKDKDSSLTAFDSRDELEDEKATREASEKGEPNPASPVYVSTDDKPAAKKAAAKKSTTKKSAAKKTASSTTEKK